MHGQRLREKEGSQCITCVSLKLTFAGLQALKPPMSNISVGGSSAVLVPSTARSATTDAAGFRKRATLWARHHISDLRGEISRGD